MGKTATLNLRVNPDVKEKAEAIAESLMKRVNRIAVEQRERDGQ